MPIVRIIIEVDGKVSSNLHFGNRTQAESQELHDDLKTKLNKFQRRS